MCMASANPFINKELHEFSGDVGSGYFDSFRFAGISLSRIHGCVNNSVEICKAKEKTFLNIHICLLGSVEYSVEQRIDTYHVSALEIKIISGEFSGIKTRLPANKATSEISIFLDEQAYRELMQGNDPMAAGYTPLNRKLSVCDMESVYKNLLCLINLPHPKNQLEYVALQGYCYAVIGEVLSRSMQHNTLALPMKQGSAERVKSLIDSNIKSNQTIRQLASISGTNECYLKKEFKALTGCSIVDYRQKQRMQHAQHLLGRGLLNIDALATEVGYQNTDHFIRIFRRHTGVHPKEYKFERGNECHEYQ
ncbi:helix-turn-helix domain-containing protein [Cellvibrio mixtus]|uniref:helix-turn-helix domain-containing protein n=1 Tax=Cellvibrio mixtus TaxID=39650 RepID=UPI000587D053|nr:AraC family transcriptional regulator [Cellvibrio mixtus]